MIYEPVLISQLCSQIIFKSSPSFSFTQHAIQLYSSHIYFEVGTTPFQERKNYQLMHTDKHIHIHVQEPVCVCVCECWRSVKNICTYCSVELRVMKRCLLSHTRDLWFYYPVKSVIFIQHESALGLLWERRQGWIMLFVSCWPQVWAGSSWSINNK